MRISVSNVGLVTCIRHLWGLGGWIYQVQ